MPCVLCGKNFRRGQHYVSLKAFVWIRDAYRQDTAEQMILEDGTSSKEAHYGCVLRRCPELIGVTYGTPRGMYD